MDTGLADKGVLVTGGAGGIGSAVVRAFAAEAARGAVHYRSSGEAAGRLARRGGGGGAGAPARGRTVCGLVFSLKNEAARIGNGVRVNVVAPGWTVTPMIGDKGLDAAHVARVTATMPLKKLGMPEDVATRAVT